MRQTIAASRHAFGAALQQLAAGHKQQAQADLLQAQALHYRPELATLQWLIGLVGLDSLGQEVSSPTEQSAPPCSQASVRPEVQSSRPEYGPEENSS